MTISAGDDERQFQELGQQLAQAVEMALPGWVEREVLRVLEAYGQEPAPALLDQARAAGAAAGQETGSRLRRLLELEVDAQRTNPLSVLRDAVGFPTDVLRRAGVPEVHRDEQAIARFPDDPYDLTPGSFGQIDPALHDLGIVWGAAKAHMVLARRPRAC